MAQFVKIRKHNNHQFLLGKYVFHLIFERAGGTTYWNWNAGLFEFKYMKILHRHSPLIITACQIKWKVPIYWSKWTSWTWVAHNYAMRFCREKLNIQFVRRKDKSFWQYFDQIIIIRTSMQRWCGNWVIWSKICKNISSHSLMYCIFTNCAKYIIQFHYITLIMPDPK